MPHKEIGAMQKQKVNERKEVNVMNEQQWQELANQLEMVMGDSMGEDVLAGLGILAGLLSIILIFMGIAYIITVICQWRIFKKAGDKGWKALIPVYNIYTEYKLFWNVKVFWIAVVLAVVSSFVGGGTEGFVGIISSLLSLASAVLVLSRVHKMSVSFGHGIGFTLGLIFLQPIFYLILAFGKSEYIGVEGDRAA